MAYPIINLDEPLLEFGYKQRISDPHAGLSLFGPYDSDLASRPGNLNYGIIGTPEGVEAFKVFANRINDPIISTPPKFWAHKDRDYSKEKEIKNRILWPPFPGFGACFKCTLPIEPAWHYVLDRNALSKAIQFSNTHKRAYEVANYYVKAIKNAFESEEAPRVIICVEPDEIWENCRPTILRDKGFVVQTLQHDDLFEPNIHEQYKYSDDFRRHLKARAMEYQIPIQIIRESTLDLSRPKDGLNDSLTFLSDRAWNLSTTLYYKSGGKPWRLSTARDGVCYVGIVFKNNPLLPNTACCAAQLFLNTGDGIVFRGATGTWRSKNDTEYHLDRKTATDLLKGVIDTYYSQKGPPLKEIFLHSRSEINVDEFKGFCDAVSDNIKIVAVRVRQEREGLRMFRYGNYPILRGTLLKINDNSAYLWGSGFKPSLLSYDGWEVPVPLRVDLQHGQADIVQVAKDILGLTKLNYNSCKLGDALPVTVGFANAVGEILVSSQDIKTPMPHFKYYI